MIERAGNEVGLEVIYPDGSCLDCVGWPYAEAWSDPAFTTNPTLLTAVVAPGSEGLGRGGLVEYGVDDLERRVLFSGAISDPVWSSRGDLALVRDGWIWVGLPGALRRITRGSAASWAPDGRRIVFVRRGWLLVGAARGRVFRRLVRGVAPAWSPDGRWIAFFDRHQRLSLVRGTGGRARRVGRVTGWTVDWQPRPAKPSAPCLSPPGSTVMAASDTAVITVEHGEAPYAAIPALAYMGCFRADGRERLLFTSDNLGYATATVAVAAVAGPYAALATNGGNTHDGWLGSGVGVYDLRTGAELPGGELWMCAHQSSPPCVSTIDQLVLSSDANTAVHMTVQDANCEPVSQPNCRYTVEEILARDSTGVHTLDSVNEPDGSPAQLTNLALTQDTVTWEDNGTPRSAQLHP